MPRPLPAEHLRSAASRRLDARYPHHADDFVHVAALGSSVEASDADRLDALSLIDELRETLDTAERRHLAALRERPEPVAWSRIARATNITRQGVEQRYLRALGGHGRNPAVGRQVLQIRRRIAEVSEHRSAARWGQAGPAGRDWLLRVLLRSRHGLWDAEEGLLSGVKGVPPSLENYWLPSRECFVRGEDVEVLEVLEESTPWEGVRPALYRRQGLPGQPEPRAHTAPGVSERAR